MGVASAQVSGAATCGSLHISGKRVEVSLLLHLPATISLASPMVRSRLPLPSLLGLFGALLMLSPELLLWTPWNLSDVPHTDAGVQKALAFSVEQYNEDDDETANYFKQLRLWKAQSEVENGSVIVYGLRVELVKTTCQKNAGRLTYEKIQECEQFPGNQKTLCQFTVVPDHSRNIMILAVTFCT